MWQFVKGDCRVIPTIRYHFIASPVECKNMSSGLGLGPINKSTSKQHVIWIIWKHFNIFLIFKCDHLAVTARFSFFQKAITLKGYDIWRWTEKNPFRAGFLYHFSSTRDLNKWWPFRQTIMALNYLKMCQIWFGLERRFAYRVWFLSMMTKKANATLD